MVEERLIYRDNLLVAKDVTIEPARNGYIVFHFIMEDRLAVLHQVSFAVKEYAADTVLPSVIKRMHPVNLPEEPPATASVVLPNKPEEPSVKGLPATGSDQERGT